MYIKQWCGTSSETEIQTRSLLGIKIETQN